MIKSLEQIFLFLKKILEKVARGLAAIPRNKKRKMKMKKLVVFAACAMLAAVTQAAAVGWNLAGATAYANDSYQFFIIGQNGATSSATITALLLTSPILSR